MTAAAASFFDGLAANYDRTWTNTPAGRMQRNAVWRAVDHLVSPGTRVLDFGCGTGEDAAHFMQLGATVDAVDSSSKMVQAARSRGVSAKVLGIEDIGGLTGAYDLVFSNFGALNCVSDLSALREPLTALTRPGGVLAICVMNRFCLWETLHYAMRLRFRKAMRRWRGSAQTSTGLRVLYPTAAAIQRALAPGFELTGDLGIGISVPPSYVTTLSGKRIERCAAFDSHLASSWFGRATADHRLLIFRRKQ